MSDCVGRYRLGDQLAVGGMGVIYTAHDTLTEREVAYKRLKIANEAARPRTSVAMAAGEFLAMLANTMMPEGSHPDVLQAHLPPGP